MTRTAVAGIFVGGSSRRMGGVPKGLLHAPDGRTLVERTCSMLAVAGASEVVLVGAQAAYAYLGLPMLEDRPPRIGPLGGLVALLERAGEGHALAIACDMPFVSTDIFEQLLAAHDAPVVAPRQGGRWEPLCARYSAPSVLPIARRRAQGIRHSLQGLLDEACAAEIALTDEDLRRLRDWDTLADVSLRS
jgi:molybdopterin-guanine dinucleotide biosynthesis protein A